MIQLERHTSAERINAVINHPAVRPWIAPGKETLDVTATVSNPDNVLLMGEHGGCMFYKIMPGIFEVHTQTLPTGRGQWTNALTETCAYWMFLKTDCYEILTRVPEGHVAAKTAALSRGMKYEFTRPKECLFRDKMVDVDIYSFRIQDWIGAADDLIEVGRAFHDKLNAEALRLGVKTEHHEDDENHNRYVGAAVTMARNGRAVKGVLFYNRWAVVSRHERIALVSRDPVVVKIDHGMFVTIKENDIEVSLP